MMELKKQLDTELQKHAVELQSLRNKRENLESEILQKIQYSQRLDRELEHAKSELDEMKVTEVEAVLP